MAIGVHPEPSAPRYARLSDSALALTGLAMTSGVIHVVAMIEHVTVSWMLGVFFAIVGAGQLAAAWWIYHQPGDQRMLKLFAAGSVLVSLLWLFSRTTGLPIGPEAGEVAKVGVADTITTLQQLVFALIVVVLVRRRDADDRPPTWLTKRLAWLSTVLGTRFTVSLLSVTLLMAAAGGHEH